MGMMHLSLISSTIGQVRLGSGLYLHLHRWRWSCGRYADDTCFTRAFVNAPTAVVGSHSKLPSSVIILINGWLSSLGSRVCTSILNPAVLAPHTLLLPLSHISSSCSHANKSYKPRSSCKTWAGGRTLFANYLDFWKNHWMNLLDLHFSRRIPICVMLCSWTDNQTRGSWLGWGNLPTIFPGKHEPSWSTSSAQPG